MATTEKRTIRVATNAEEVHMNPATTFSLYIPAGTKVLAHICNETSLVTLVDDAFIRGARHTPENGGGYEYKLGSREYYVAEGCCTPSRDDFDEEAGWQHADGFVVLTG